MYEVNGQHKAVTVPHCRLRVDGFNVISGFMKFFVPLLTQCTGTRLPADVDDVLITTAADALLSMPIFCLLCSIIHSQSRFWIHQPGTSFVFTFLFGFFALIGNTFASVCLIINARAVSFIHVSEWRAYNFSSWYVNFHLATAVAKLSSCNEHTVRQFA